MASGKHFYELDSLRGVAAVTVVFHHFRLVFGQQTPQLLDRSLMRVLIPGHEAVLLFFVLSGFVLTLPYNRQAAPRYRLFLVRRVCRIYLPYLGALGLAIAGCMWFHHPPIPSNVWANATWLHSPTGPDIVQHLFFIGDYDWGALNTAFWSLIHEMRISLVFPCIAFLVLRVRSTYALILAACLSILARPAAGLCVSLLHGKISQAAIFRTCDTIHFSAFFIAGSLLAIHIDSVNAWFGRMSRPRVYLFGLFSVCLYAGSSLANRLNPHFLQHPDELAGTGAAMLIVLALNARGFRTFLQHPVVHYLGRISYSVYLVHGTVLFTLIGLYYGRRPFLPLLPVYLLATLAISDLFHRLIERPSMALGRKLGNRFSRSVVPSS